MRKTVTLLVFLTLLAGLSMLPATAQDEQTQKTEEGSRILDRWIEAQGGRDNLSKIIDTTSTGTMEMIQMGLSGAITMYQKEPNKLRMDIEVMGMIVTQAYDGETAWMTNPQTGVSEEMPEQFQEDIRRQAMGNDTLLNPEKYGIIFTHEGQKTIEGKDYLILKQAFDDGFENTFFIDPDTYLVYKSKAMGLNAMGVEVETETFMSDFREVEGTMVPFAITITQDGEEFMTVALTEITYNSGLENSLFDMQ